MYEAEEAQWWYAGQRAIAGALLTAALPASGGVRRLLDAGCGTGFNLLELGRLGRAAGVDLSADAIAFCRERGVRAARASVLALPFADATFDAVTSFDVLYHAWVTDDGAAARELARVLRPGGVLLVRVPAMRALWGAHDTEVQSRHRYTRGELRALLAGAGLDVVRATYCNSILFPVLFGRRTLDRVLCARGLRRGLPAGAPRVGVRQGPARRGRARRRGAVVAGGGERRRGREEARTVAGRGSADVLSSRA